MQYDVVGIGNAIVDIIANVNDDFITENHMAKDSMMLIDEDTAKKMYASLQDYKVCSGGSIANTVAAMAMAGLSTGFIGKVADDELGDTFKKDISDIGVDYKTQPLKNSVASGRSMVYVTSDAMRTMNTYLGASLHISVSDIDEDMIKNSSIFYVEGYLWDSEPARFAIMKAIKIAKDNNVKIAFSLSDSFCVDRYRSDFISFIRDYVNIVFCNEDEAKSLFNIANIDVVSSTFAEYCDITAITMGSNGAVAIAEGKMIQVGAAPVSSIVDTTGAGDLFAAGFLSGLCKKMDIETCLSIGTSFAGEIISHLGARPEKDLKEILNKWG